MPLGQLWMPNTRSLLVAEKNMQRGRFLVICDRKVKETVLGCAARCSVASNSRRNRS
jgi:hypothetical protein